MYQHITFPTNYIYLFFLFSYLIIFIFSYLILFIVSGENIVKQLEDDTKNSGI